MINDTREGVLATRPWSTHTLRTCRVTLVSTRRLLSCLLLCFGAPLAAQPEVQEDRAEPLSIVLPDTPPPDLQNDWDYRLNTLVQVEALPYASLARERTDTSSLRRLRLGGSLEWRWDWRLHAGIDLADGAQLREFVLSYRASPVHFSIGRMVEPFSLLQASSAGNALLERPLALGMAPGYGLGGQLSARGENWGGKLGLFKATRNELYFGGRKEDALTIHGHWLPLKTDRWLLHLGLSASVRRTAGNTGEDFDSNGSAFTLMNFVSVPETLLLQGLNIESEVIGTDDYKLFGGELALRHGALLMKAETLLVQVGDAVVVNPFTGDYTLTRPRYHSGYAEFSWAITGETRDYSVRHGSFSRIYPRRPLAIGGRGAWEIAARYSYADFLQENIGGETGRASSLGLNWYPNASSRISALALHVTEQGNNRRESAWAAQLRVSYQGELL